MAPNRTGARGREQAVKFNTSHENERASDKASSRKKKQVRLGDAGRTEKPPPNRKGGQSGQQAVKFNTSHKKERASDKASSRTRQVRYRLRERKKRVYIAQGWVINKRDRQSVGQSEAQEKRKYPLGPISKRAWVHIRSNKHKRTTRKHTREGEARSRPPRNVVKRRG